MEEELSGGEGDGGENSEEKKKPKEQKKRELTLDEIYRVHGTKVKNNDLTRLRLNGKKFTSVKMDDNWDQVQPVTADFSINFLNLGIGHYLQIYLTV